MVRDASAGAGSFSLERTQWSGAAAAALLEVEVEVVEPVEDFPERGRVVLQHRWLMLLLLLLHSGHFQVMMPGLTLRVPHREK